ncbi:hypothetical protein [Bathymodiolus septemdierum thioautotrophic gill symbiont]|nr:hypothetical protein [Bathymodiolus septemdierum thioautotrophic gill symbiont]
MLTLLAFYFSFDDSQTPKASQTNLIVIKEAEVKKTQVVITPINDEIGDIQAKPKQPEILENLDEINQER